MTPEGSVTGVIVKNVVLVVRALSGALLGLMRSCVGA